MTPPLAWYETSTNIVVVPWAEVTRLLGREHALTHEDDDAIMAALAATLPPPPAYTFAPWSSGFFAPEGWCVAKVC